MSRFFTLFISLLIFYNGHGTASVAINWEPFGPGTARTVRPYQEWNDTFSLFIQPTVTNSNTLNIDPMSNANNIPTSAPIVNTSPFPFMTASLNNSDPGVYAVFLDTGFVIHPGEYFFIGGMFAQAELDIDFYNANRVTRLNDLMVASNTFPATENSPGSGFQTGSLDILYVPLLVINPNKSVGRISVDSGLGNSGVLFLQNTSNEIVEAIQFTFRPGKSSPVYFGVTVTPEPPIYLMISGFLIVAGIGAWVKDRNFYP
jgi:hypothetical protein